MYSKYRIVDLKKFGMNTHHVYYIQLVLYAQGW